MARRALPCTESRVVENTTFGIGRHSRANSSSASSVMVSSAVSHTSIASYSLRPQTIPARWRVCSMWKRKISGSGAVQLMSSPGPAMKPSSETLIEYMVVSTGCLLGDGAVDSGGMCSSCPLTRNPITETTDKGRPERLDATEARRTVEVIRRAITAACMGAGSAAADPETPLVVRPPHPR